jgi:hypothetical protein
VQDGRLSQIQQRSTPGSGACTPGFGGLSAYRSRSAVFDTAPVREAATRDHAAIPGRSVSLSVARCSTEHVRGIASSLPSDSSSA